MEKKTLQVNCTASEKIQLICNISKILYIISSLVGALLLIIGWSDYDDELVIIGVAVLSISLTNLIVVLPIIRGFVVMVESAEYTKANIEMYHHVEKMGQSEEVTLE